MSKVQEQNNRESSGEFIVHYFDIQHVPYTYNLYRYKSLCVTKGHQFNSDKPNNVPPEEVTCEECQRLLLMKTLNNL